MATYIIGYDLHEGEDYSDLIRSLKAFPNWWHHLDSTWLVQSDLPIKQVRDYLWKHMRNDDKLLVMHYFTSKQGGSGAWEGFNQTGQQWLMANL